MSSRFRKISCEERNTAIATQSIYMYTNKKTQEVQQQQNNNKQTNKRCNVRKVLLMQLLVTLNQCKKLIEL